MGTAVVEQPEFRWYVDNVHKCIGEWEDLADLVLELVVMVWGHYVSRNVYIVSSTESEQKEFLLVFFLSKINLPFNITKSEESWNILWAITAFNSMRCPRPWGIVAVELRRERATKKCFEFSNLLFSKRVSQPNLLSLSQGMTSEKLLKGLNWKLLQEIL